MKKEINNNPVKTTILIDKTLKKLAQVHCIKEETSLSAFIEKLLKRELLDK